MVAEIEVGFAKVTFGFGFASASASEGLEGEPDTFVDILLPIGDLGDLDGWLCRLLWLAQGLSPHLVYIDAH